MNGWETIALLCVIICFLFILIWQVGGIVEDLEAIRQVIEATDATP